jgi:hypothetical protein
MKQSRRVLRARRLFGVSAGATTPAAPPRASSTHTFRDLSDKWTEASEEKPSGEVEQDEKEK